MTGVAITHTWTDGATTRLEVEVATSYPDALNEAVARVLDMYRTVVCDGGDGDE